MPPVPDRERRRRTILRRRAAALGTLATLTIAVLALAAGAGSGPRRRTTPLASTTTASLATTSAPTPAATTTARPATSAVPQRPRRYAVGELTLHLVDGTRRVSSPGTAAAPRRLQTIVRYPAQGTPDGTDHPGAAPAAGRFPLVVFGHGFAVTPATYASLLRAWASAGYVVAAPWFPRTASSAPGGPDELDLPNQPADMSFVISSLLAADSASAGRLRGLIAPHEIAVAGQSDGGDTALAVAYDPRFRDPRVRAAMILSGAEIPFLRRFRIALGAPVLLAVQGLQDRVNPPQDTRAFWDPAPPPKFLLELFGAGHLAPYVTPGPQLRIVERVTTAFLDRDLKHLPGSLVRMFTDADVANRSTLLSSR